MRKSIAIGFALLSAAETPWYEAGSHSNRPMKFGNIREGYKIFRSNCKKCHFRGNIEKDIFLCPESKNMTGWNRVFARENTVAEENSCLEGLSTDELMDLNDYLYTHASDARNPNDDMECGL